MLLSALGVADETIVDDYVHTGRYMQAFIDRIGGDPSRETRPERLPSYALLAEGASMELLLSTLRREHSSVASYLESLGVASCLVGRLQRALLAPIVPPV